MADFGLKPEGPDVPKPKVNVGLISNIKPREVPRPTAHIAESDRAAEATGFTSREPGPKVEPYIRPLLGKRKPEQRYPLSLMPTVETRLRFNAYAKKHNLSLPLALERLLDESESLATMRGER
jgi:hypothetical protein